MKAVIVLKIINLIKSEFIKNYNIKKIIICILLLTLASLFIVYKTDNILVEYENAGQTDAQYLKNYISNLKKNFTEQDINSLKTIEEKISYSNEKNFIKYNYLIMNDVTSSNDWKYDFVTNYIIPLARSNDLIEILNATNTSETVEICSVNNIDEQIKEFLNKACSLTIEERNELYQKNTKLITDYENLLKENKYYLYLQYKLDNNLLDEDEYKIVKILIAKKIENSDNFLTKNYIQYQKLKENATMKIDTFEEYQETHKNSNDYHSYQEYLAYNTNLKNKAIESRKILLYSTEHEIKQDIFYTYLDNVSEFNMYITPKLKVNRILHLSVIVMLIISITNSGIVSREHSNGTIKNIITAPVKRWKILLSKFLYLILDTYIIWLLGLIILSICAGIRFGFTELITPKLIVSGGKVIEVNYYLYLIKNILIASIPIISFLSILFFLSTVTLNTSLTVGTTSIISVLSIIMWLMQLVSNFKYLIYTPFWYLDSGYIFMNTESYQMSLSTVAYSIKTGIIISVITTVVLLLITNIIYSKRDIKNIQ